MGIHHFQTVDRGNAVVKGLAKDKLYERVGTLHGEKDRMTDEHDAMKVSRRSSK